MLVRDRPPRFLAAVRSGRVVPIARCEIRACPFAWPADTGRHRCADHDDDDPLRRAREELGIGELAATAPGDRGAIPERDDSDYAQ